MSTIIALAHSSLRPKPISHSRTNSYGCLPSDPSDPIPHLPSTVISVLADNTESVIALLIDFFFPHFIFSLMDGSTDGIVKLNGQTGGWDRKVEEAKKMQLRGLRERGEKMIRKGQIIE